MRYMDTADEDLDGKDDTDDDGMMTEDGFGVVTPAFDESETLESLEDPDEDEPQAELPPQEAYDAMKYMAPLSRSETQILEDTPFLDEHMRWVDDPDHSEAMMSAMRDGHKGMDKVLEDQMYGDSGSGFSLRPKKLLKGVRRGAAGFRRIASAVASTATKFVPGRDKKKAQLVKGLNAKLVRERANWLQNSDLKKGTKAPRSKYETLAKAWSKSQLAKAGIPTSFASGSNPITASILGSDVIGSWYNPFSWFSSKAKYILVDTEGQRLAEMNATEYQAYEGARAAQQESPEGASPEQPPEEANMPTADESGKLYRSIKDPLDGLSGNDEQDMFDLVLGGEATLRAVGNDSSIGEFATQILGDRPLRRDASGFDMDSLTSNLHKLNPLYWAKGRRTRRFIDIEAQSKAEENRNAKYSAQREKELEKGERALTAKQAAQAAIDRSSELERRLQDIESATSGIGAEAAHEGKEVAARTKGVAKSLSSKLEAGEKLNASEVSMLKQCLKNCGRLQALHKSLHQMSSAEPVSSSGYRENPGAKSDFLGHQRRLRRHRRPAPTTSSGAAGPVGQKQWAAAVAVAATNPTKFGAFARQKGWKMDARQVKHLSTMVKIARQNMTQQAKASGASGDDVGFSWKKLGAVAALPFAAAAYVAYKGTKGAYDATKWAGKKVFGRRGGGGGSSSQSRIVAARNRRLAAEKRAEAAMAKTDEERAVLAEEARAADAEAAAKEAEVEDPSAEPGAEDGTQEDGSQGDGSSSQGRKKMKHKIYTADDFSGSAFVGYVVENLPEGHQKIAKEAASNTPMGKKIRAGATLYHAAKKGNPKARLALAKMQKKAASGDAQAQKDLNAVRAGKIAVHSKGKAHAAITRRTKSDVLNKRGVDARSKLEAAAGNKLARMSRKKQLAKISHIERLASQGNRPAKAKIAKVVAKAQGGDKKAQTTVAALQLAKHVRLASKNPREARNLRAAGKVVASANRGNRKALRQALIVRAAAKKGQPNALRAQKRLELAARVERALRTGKVSGIPSSKKGAAMAADQRRYSFLATKVSRGVATREEALAAAKIAAKYGSKGAAGSLALRANSLPSATTSLKSAAAATAAAQAGNKDAQSALAEVLSSAERGDARGINAAGKLAAVKALEDHKNGAPMAPHIAEATGIVVRARAGDPEAARIAERVGAAAQSGNPKAIEAAVALTAASSILAATAAKPAAQKQWVDKALEARGQKLDTKEAVKANEEFAGLYAKVQAGTASQSEARRARELAEALGRPKLGAEISALMPPADAGDALTSLPDAAQSDIKTFGQGLVESLKAILLATRDPLANYREGIRSRSAGSLLPAVGPVKTAGEPDALDAGPRKRVADADFEKKVAESYRNQDAQDEQRRRSARRRPESSLRHNEMSRELGSRASWSEGKY